VKRPSAAARRPTIPGSRGPKGQLFVGLNSRTNEVFRLVRLADPPRPAAPGAGGAADLTEHKRLEGRASSTQCRSGETCSGPDAELVKVNETLRAEIVERQRAEEALQESQALLRSVTEATPDLIFVKDHPEPHRDGQCRHAPTDRQTIEEVIGKDDRQHYDDPAVGEAIIANDRRINGVRANGGD